MTLSIHGTNFWIFVYTPGTEINAEVRWKITKFSKRNTYDALVHNRFPTTQARSVFFGHLTIAWVDRRYRLDTNLARPLCSRHTKIHRVWSLDGRLPGTIFGTDHLKSLPRLLPGKKLQKYSSLRKSFSGQIFVSIERNKPVMLRELYSDHASFGPIQRRWPSCQSISTFSVASTRAICAAWNSRYGPIWQEPRHFENLSANNSDALPFVRCCTLRDGVVRLDRVHPIRPISLSYSHLAWSQRNVPPSQPIDSTRAHRRNSVCATKSPI